MTQLVYTDAWVDAQEQHWRHPDKFNVPSKTSLDAIKANDTVKICNGQERFWVTVQKVKGNTVRGIVDNHLVSDCDYGYGDTVTFQKRHIYDIHTSEDRQRAADSLLGDLMDVVEMMKLAGMTDEEIIQILDTTRECETESNN